MSLTSLACFILSCVIGYALVLYIIWHIKRRHLYKKVAKFNGPPIVPLLGNAHMFIGNGEEILKRLNECNEVYSSPCRLWMGPFLLMIINDPEQAKEVCNNSSTMDKGYLFRDLAGPLVGNGLLTAPVARWRRHRRLIEPAFNKRILESYVEIFATQAKIFTEQIEKYLNAPEFEIFDLLSWCTLDMVCETAMGVKMKSQTDKNNHYVKILHEVYASGSEKLFKFWLHFDFIFYRTKQGIEGLKKLQFLHDYSDNIIKSKRIELLKRDSQQQSAETDNEDGEKYFKPRRESYLDILMKQADDTGKLSDTELREEVDTLIATSNDTPSRTMSFVLLMLASHPDIQAEVYQELYEIYGDTDVEDRPVVPEDLPHMRYLNRVINETLRLFPPGAFMMRSIWKDVKIGENCTLPKGGSVVIAIMNIHRREDYWPDPLKFDPDRFLPDAIAKRHPCAFMPFSYGPRKCVAINFTMMMMKTVLATTLRKYIIKKDHPLPVKDIRLSMELLIKPTDPIKIRIEKRTRNETALFAL